MAMSKWVPESEPKILRRVGKTSEEAAELVKVTSRIIIQGIHGVDPKDGKPNIDALTDEIADVIAQCEVSIETLDLDVSKISERIRYKKSRMAEWEAMFDKDDQ